MISIGTEFRYFTNEIVENVCEYERNSMWIESISTSETFNPILLLAILYYSSSS